MRSWDEAAGWVSSVFPAQPAGGRMAGTEGPGIGGTWHHPIHLPGASSGPNPSFCHGRHSDSRDV